MPNHVQNRLKVEGDPALVKELFAFIAGDADGARIDFNKIIPMPPDLKLEMCLGVDEAVKRSLLLDWFSKNNVNFTDYKSPLDFDDEQWAHYIQGLNNARKYKYIYWYEWAIDNWGTKWNSYNTPSTADTHDTIYFQTAWEAPYYVIEALAKKFPKLKLILTYADEDAGYNVGIIEFEGDKEIDSEIKAESKEAYEIFFELHPSYRKDYIFVNGTYKIIETEE
jgi:hypothetical protein